MDREPVRRGARRLGQSRAHERGAALFVVVLVITMLTAIGVFAARSSRLTTTASGHTRQMTQTHYLTEYGMQCAVAALSINLAPALDHMQSQPDTTCFGMTGSVGATCLKLYPPSLEQQLIPGGKLIEPPTASKAGSLGPASLDPSFVIEVTNLAGGRYVPGYDLSPGSSAKFAFKSITLTGIGQIRVAGASTWASSEAARARLTVGPLPE